MEAKTSDELRRVGHCLYRSQRSRVYYAILKRGGKQIKRSLKTTDQALAKRRLNALSERASRLTTSGSGAITFTDLAARWLLSLESSSKASSFRRQEVIARSLGHTFGPSQVRRISKAMVEAWAAQRSKEVAARTFNYERESLVRIMQLAIRDGLMLDNPALVIKRKKSTQKTAVIPTREQYRTLINAMGELRADAASAIELCELLALSGCRLGEAVELCWLDIDFDAKLFRVTGGQVGTKNHETRVVPLFPSLDSFIKSLLPARDAPPTPSERIIKIGNAKTAMSHACRNAGLPHFTHHHLRHFFCSNAIEAGVDFKTIAGWLGHKDGGLLVAKTYGHLRDEHSARMAERMTFGVSDE
jgi:integrase